MRRAVWPFLVSVAVVGVLFLLVFPARTYMAQRRSLAAAETKVKVLTSGNKALDQRVASTHQSIVDALERGDVAAAERAIGAHYELSTEAMTGAGLVCG